MQWTKYHARSEVGKKGHQIMPSTANAAGTAEVLHYLSDPSSYAEDTETVEVIETHISWVFLTDHFAYKLKKPVRFTFLDFSTLKARELACAEEIRLNRRLSNRVYHSLLPITVDATGKLELDGDGSPVDFVVKMRRLARRFALDELIRQNKANFSQVNELVDHLVNFYIQLPPKIVQPVHYYQNLYAHCQENRTDLLDTAGKRNWPAIRRIHSLQLRFLWLAKERFLNRVRDGRIVDGHGDLRAEHIFLESPPVVIDCLEFSEELRQVDVVDDLSCLAMDCNRLGSREIGNKLMSDYEKQSGDRPSDNTINFFKSYRACVRTKVAALYLQQANISSPKHHLRELHQYLEWADHHASHLGRPMLLIIGGLMGSGKSTLACALAKLIAIDVLSTDEIRNSLFGPSKKSTAYSHGKYRPELRRQVYEEVFERAKELLDYGQSVVLDGTFLTNELRIAAISMGKKHGATPIFVECECAPKTAFTRIAERAETGKGLSEARIEFFDQQLAEREKPCASLHHISINTTNSIIESLDTLAEQLRRIDGIES